MFGCMMRRLLAMAGLGVLIISAACERAQRYPASIAKPSAKEDKPTAEPIWSWLPPAATPDLPIIFIAQSDPEWAKLSRFWNHFPPPGAGLVRVGQHPLASAASFVALAHTEKIKIKVPRGLPDPTPHIPPANPPTEKKWKLGRQIFFERKLMSGADRFACATCHQPEHGFAEERGLALGGIRNTPALINAVYHRQQYWDGRATALEETLVRTLQDELQPFEKNPDRLGTVTHRWGGLVNELDRDPDYHLRFTQVFGIPRVTQDAVARALATYMRTILVGDSLYDRAEDERRRAKAAELGAEHFLAVLNEATAKALPVEDAAKKDVAQRLENGHAVFQTKGCASCHPAPLFTDGDFHNVGIAESARPPIAGQEMGRFAHVPIGLKEARLIGAFKTPTLRGVTRTAPYFHDGSYLDLHAVVDYFDRNVSFNDSLASPLRGDDGGHAKVLHLSAADVQDLLLFLHALDGAPDPILTPGK
jgi:cytochrome c peroxidase